MKDYTEKQLIEALKEVSSIISKCEKMQIKFAPRTSQHTLLKNRLKAMYISKLLIETKLSESEQTSPDQADESVVKSEFKATHTAEYYTQEDLEEALCPICSIISKCEKGQSNSTEGTSSYTRFKKLLSAMYISQALIENKLIK